MVLYKCWAKKRIGCRCKMGCLTSAHLTTYHQSNKSVTAPNDAELTSLAYFANTPRV